jgi:hypothetical protein
MGIKEDVINKLARYSLGSIMGRKRYAVIQYQKNVYNHITELSMKAKYDFIKKNRIINSKKILL